MHSIPKLEERWVTIDIIVTSLVFFILRFEVGPLGGNQLIVALNAICTEARTTFGCYHSHGDSAAVGSK